MSATIMRIELARSAISNKLMRKIARGLSVQPFDLLNLDTQNNDLEYVIEKMRQDSQALRIMINSDAGVPTAA